MWTFLLAQLPNTVPGVVDSLNIRVVRGWPFTYAYCVEEGGDVGYVGTDEGVYLIDPTFEGKPQRFNAGGKVRGLARAGGFLFALLDGTDGISILSANGGNVVGTYVSGGYCKDLAVSGKLGFLAAGGDGVVVLDLTNPADPQELATWDMPGFCQGIAVSGKYVAVAMGDKGVALVDASNPASPRTVLHVADITALDVCTFGKYLVVAAGTRGLVVLDPSRENPLVGEYDTPGLARKLAQDGKYIYLADGTGGLRVFTIRNGEPILKAYYDTAGNTLDVAASPPYVFVADGNFGALMLLNLLHRWTR